MSSVVRPSVSFGPGRRRGVAQANLRDPLLSGPPSSAGARSRPGVTRPAPDRSRRRDSGPGGAAAPPPARRRGPPLRPWLHVGRDQRAHRRAVRQRQGNRIPSATKAAGSMVGVGTMSVCRRSAGSSTPGLTRVSSAIGTPGTWPAADAADALARVHVADAEIRSAVRSLVLETSAVGIGPAAPEGTRPSGSLSMASGRQLDVRFGPDWRRWLPSSSWRSWSAFDCPPRR